MSLAYLWPLFRPLKRCSNCQRCRCTTSRKVSSLAASIMFAPPDSQMAVWEERSATLLVMTEYTA